MLDLKILIVFVCFSFAAADQINNEDLQDVILKRVLELTVDSLELKFDAIQEKCHAVENKTQEMDGKGEKIKQEMEQLKRGLSSVTQGFVEVTNKLSSHDEKIVTLTIAQLEEMAHGNCSFNEDTFRCECEPGWHGDFCHLDVNECITHPCHNGGHCNNTAGGYQCHCEGTGFAGPKCEDIDKCFKHWLNNEQQVPCLNGGTCQNSRESYSCRCPNNFNGLNCENKIYFPYGPQKNVPETKVTGGGWTRCHLEGFYANQTSTSLAAIQNKCSKKKLMMGCRKTGSSIIALLAAAPDGRKALESTGSEKMNPGRIINGSKWYRRPGASYGFAPQYSTLYLNNVDEADKQGKDTLNPRGEMRLSYSPDGVYGGYRCDWRCGKYCRPAYSTEWEKLYYHAD